MSRARNAGKVACRVCARAALCGDRACRVRGMQVKLCFLDFRMQPSAGIVRVERLECRKNCVFWIDVWMCVQMVHVHSFSGTECG